MARKLAFLGVIGALALVAIMLGGQVHRAQAQPTQDEIFNADITECLNQAGVPADPALSGGIGGINCPLVEPAGIGQLGVDEPLDVALPAGGRLGVPFYYSGPGWFHKSDAQVPDGTLVGDVISKTDLLDDGVVDVLASSSGATTPESFYKRTDAWGPGTGICDATDESWLNTALPAPVVMAPYYRQLACLNTLWLGGVTKFTIANMSLNSITLQPTWAQPAWGAVAVANPMRATTVLLGGAPGAPSTTFTPRMTPQDSLSHTFSNVVGNPPAGSPVGIYPRWATELSDADFSNLAKTITLATSCKVIGPPGTIIADTDSDCLADSAGAAGVPYEGEAISSMEGSDCPGGTGSSVTSAALWDSDGDGLPDGVEVAWGSNPCKRDTDGDGRSDLEEMIGPTQFLTNPTNTDTDGDGVLDGGWKVASTGALTPSVPDLNGDGTADAGREVQVSGRAADGLCATNPPTGGYPCWSGNGSSHTRMAWDIVGTDIVKDNFPAYATITRTADVDATITRTVGGAMANDVHLTFTVPGGGTVTSLAAGDGTSTCGAPTAGTEAPAGTWTVTWSPACVAQGQTIRVNVRYIGPAAPTLTAVTWSPGSLAEPGPFLPLVPAATVVDAAITRTVAGAIANDVHLTFTVPGGSTITSVRAGDGTSTCGAPTAGIEAPAGTWTVTWSPACVTQNQTIRVKVGYAGAAPTLTGVTWSPGSLAEPGPFPALLAAFADDVHLTFTVPGGSAITKVAAGDGTSLCPDTLGTEAPVGTWTVTWPSECMANGKTIRVGVGYTGGTPTLTGVTWTDAGVPIESEPGPFPPLVGGPTAARDNCPSIPNFLQTNTDLDTATTMGHGDLFGNSCDTDWDNDGMANVTEVSLRWDTASKSCTTATGATTVAAATDPLKADTDGDGILDGIECEMASNPKNATDVPAACSGTTGALGLPRPDLDGDFLCGTALATLQIDNEEVNWRTDDLSKVGGGVSHPDPNGNGFSGDNDADNDGDTLKDGCEVMIAGTSPEAIDTDGNGVPDNLEVVGPNAGAVGNVACLDKAVGTLTAGINASQTLIDVTAGHGLKVGDVIMIGSEYMRVTGVTLPTSVNVTRGYQGSTAAAHLAGVPVLRVIMAPNIEYGQIGNGASMTAKPDVTVPNSKGGNTTTHLPTGGGRTADTDKDGLFNYQDPDPLDGDLANMDYTYDDNGNGNPCIPLGSDAADDGPSWDANCNGILDGQETGSPPVCKFTAPATQDTDGDGLMDVWEVCKWGTNPNLVDSDSDGIGDCVEAVDTDGNGIIDFGGDALNSARATLLPAGVGAGKFGKDGDFDLNGNNVIVGDFGKDTLNTAKIALHILPCK